MNNYRGGYGGGFGGGNLQQLMQRAQKMQEEMEKAKEKLSNTDFTGTSGGNMVEVVMNGDKKVKAVHIKPDVVDPDDIEMLEDLIQSAVNDCVEKITAAEQQILPNLPQGL